MKPYRLALFILCILLFGYNGYANTLETDSLSSHFRINEEWYLQLQGGIGYSIAENTKNVSPLKIISPQLTFAYGKRFTHVWGGRLQVALGKDKGAFYLHDKNSPLYSFSHVGISGIGSFNLTEFFNRKNIYYIGNSWNISALFGLGAFYTSFGFTKDMTGQNVLNRNNKTYLSLFTGAEVSKYLCDNWEINLELGCNWLSKKYNGYQGTVESSKSNELLNLSVGVRYTFNRAPKRTRLNKETGLENRQASLSPPRQPHSIENQMDSTAAIYKVEKQTIVVEKVYSIEELLEMIDNNELLQGKKLDRTRVYFDYGSDNIKPFVAIQLDKIGELMKHSNIVLLIRGFTTESHLPFTNSLSEKRIKKVRDYLVSLGINRERLVYQIIKISETSQDEIGMEQNIEIESLSL